MTKYCSGEKTINLYSGEFIRLRLPVPEKKWFFKRRLSTDGICICNEQLCTSLVTGNVQTHFIHIRNIHCHLSGVDTRLK
jgi:hypothetical protein